MFLLVAHFLDLLLGRDVTLIPLYKHLMFAMTNMSSTMSRCQIRQLNNISQFCQSFTHITEIHSLVVDTLSCLEINAPQVSDFGITVNNLLLTNKQMLLDGS